MHQCNSHLRYAVPGKINIRNIAGSSVSKQKQVATSHKEEQEMIDVAWNFLNPVIKKLFKARRLEIDDLRMSSQIDSEQIAAVAKQLFYNQEKYHRSFFRTYAKITKIHFLAVFLIAPVSALCFVAQPICIEMFQHYLNLDAFFQITGNEQNPSIRQLSTNEVFKYLFTNLGPFILLNFIAQLMYSICNSLLCYNTIQLAVKFSAMTLEMLFQKLQRLSEATKNANAQGSLMNLLYCDIFKVQQFLQISYWGPLIIANLLYCSIVLGVQVDPRGLIMYVALVVMVLFSITFAVQMQRQLNRVAPVRDQRSQQVQELLQGMKVIKLFNLHDWQQNKIMNTRKHELQIVLKSNLFNSCSMVMTWGAYGIITCVVVGFLIQQNKFNVLKVFTTISLITLCADAIGFLPQLVTYFQDSLVSFKRIQAFLTLPETDQYQNLKQENNENPFGNQDSDIAISITGGQNFSHSNEQDLLVRPELDQQFYEKLDKKKILKKDYANIKSKIQHVAAKVNQSSDQIIQQLVQNILENNFQLEQEVNDEICKMLELPSATYYADVLNYHTELFKPQSKDDASIILFKMYLQLCILEYHLNGKPITKPAAVIKGLNLEIKKRELIGIKGNIASGKSSLFLAILGELRKVNDESQENTNGNYNRIVNGSIAFAPQSSPIFSMTIRENICFFKPYDEQKYKRVIEVSCLELDFTQFANGDQTVVGSKGVTLSGGQRARISLARALYSDADIYLLDDPLSALDPHVGKQIWTNAIIGYLMARQKTVLIASHQTHYFKQCSRIIELGDGKIISDELNGELASHIDSYTDTANERTTENTSVQNNQNKLVKELKNATNDSENQNTDEEAKAITCKLYCKYFGSGNKFLFFMFVIFLIVYGAAFQYQNVIISQWASDQYGFLDKNQDDFNEFFDKIKQQINVPDQFIRQVALNYFNAITSQGNSNPYSIIYYYIFVGCTGGVLLGILLMQLFYYLFAASSSKFLYETTINKLIHTMLRFFDVVPGGRIINVLIKDCETIDIILARYFVGSAISFMYIFGMIVTICAISYPSTIIIIPCVIIYILIFRKFRIIVPNLRRLEAATRTHVFNLCQEQMEYLITIRAYKKEQEVLNKFRSCLQDSVKSQYYTYSMVQWIQLRFGIIGAILNVLVCIISCIISPFSLDVAQFSGVIVINCVNLQLGVLIFVDNSTQFDAVMPTIERAMLFHGLEDEEKINSSNIQINIEAAEYKENAREIPQEGFTIKHLQMRYRPELKLTLKNMTVHFEKGDHVSIIGRTGQGKSSFVVSLLKLYQPESNGYHISLNGRDLDSISLHELRDIIAIIPQEPILFSGTVRQQLCEYSRNKASGLPYQHVQRIPDQRIWEMLEMVKLSDFIKKQPGGLDCQVIAGGENFSSGQRQLICILRALLKNTEVVLLDEATSYVDKETDKIIQDLIKVHLNDKIVLSIAHRMETVLSMDKVLVVQNGCVAEYGKKYQLYMQNGIFTSMCQKAGLIVEENQN